MVLAPLLLLSGLSYGQAAYASHCGACCYPSSTCDAPAPFCCPTVRSRVCYQTVWEDRVETPLRPVYTTVMKECHSSVYEPVYEQCFRTQRYTVCKPVWESYDVVQKYTVCRPVYEQHVKTHATP